MVNFAYTLTFILVVYAGTCAAKPTVQDICAGCSIMNGVGFMKHHDCNKFIHCYEDGDSNVLGIVQECGPGMAWNQDLLTCVASSTCPTSSGICANEKDGTMLSDPPNCRSYRVCWRGYSPLYCCPDGQYYKQNVGCTRTDSSNKCEERCFTDSSFTTKRPCDRKRPVAGIPSAYEEYVSGWGWIQRPCPVGLRYVQEDCDCTRFVAVPMDISCKPELYLPFNDTYADQSDKGTYIRNERVVIMDGRAVFNGDNSQLIVPRFTNVETSTIIIKVKYTSNHKTLSGPQSILSNSDCGIRPSILITEDSQRIHFNIGTVAGTTDFETVVSVNQTSANEKDIVLRFNKGVLAGRLGSDVSVEFGVPGVIRGTHCALHIGNSDAASGGWFTGEIEELAVYMCDI